MTSKKTVLIVGAGPSGLAALKEMKALGISATAVDAQSAIGGVFARDSGVTYEKLHLTIPNMFMAFSDFPPKDKDVKYWSKDEYTDYLENYVEHFDLASDICLNTTVQKAELIDESSDVPTKRWKVCTRPNSTKAKDTTEFYDYLIVAVGANHTPKLPMDLFKDFTSKVMHSSEYHSASQVEGKRVLVVGIGESAVDVACSASKTASSTTIWSRRSPDMPPRFLEEFIKNTDYNEVEMLENQNGLLPKDFLDSITTSRIVRNLPNGIWGLCLHGLTHDMKKLHGPKHKIFHDLCEVAWESDYYAADTPQIPCKSGVLFHPAAQGDLDICISPELQFDGGTATFVNPSYYGHNPTEDSDKSIDIEVDVIVACTGYKMDFNWITGINIEANPRQWYKHCFPTQDDAAQHIAFLGYARPHQGGIPQLAEMLARYIGQIQVGNLDLPTNYGEIAQHDGNAEHEIYHVMSHYSTLVDYYAFMLSVAGLIGCTPVMPRNIDGMIKHWTFPMWPCFFRMQGPGANPTAVAEVLDKFEPLDSLAPMPLLAVEIIFSFIMPFLNLFSYLFGFILDIGKSTTLPRLHKWRMSKGYVLYSHMNEGFDFTFACGQIVACIAVLIRLIHRHVVMLSTRRYSKVTKLD